LSAVLIPSTSLRNYEHRILSAILLPVFIQYCEIILQHSAGYFHFFLLPCLSLEDKLSMHALFHLTYEYAKTQPHHGSVWVSTNW